ncbi:MAG: restriction endonuclease subunit S, partial [Sarcina sp.]
MEELKEGWKSVKLEEIAIVIDSLHKTPRYSDNGYNMVRVTDVKQGKLNLNTCIKVSEEVFYEFTKKYQPKKNDIIITRVGSYGVFSYVDTDKLFCLGQNIAIINPKCNKKFLYFYLISKNIKNQIESLVVGTTQKTLSLKNINNLSINLPPLETQEKIASILSALDDKIELNNEMNKTLEEMAQTLFKRWFIDFDFP